ncbi:hypothetical protein UlMin_022960 [Ulmus minor]
MALNQVPQTAALFTITLFFLALAPTSLQATKYKHKDLKETSMVFYIHDYTGRNSTTAPIAGVKKPFQVLDFGTALAVDDKLTEALDWNSPEVGRARGIYVNSALDGTDLHFMMSIVFTNKKYNGSTLEIQGSDRYTLKYREISVVSGTGQFRFAKGFVVLETVNYDAPNMNAIIRGNLTVLHY